MSNSIDDDNPGTAPTTSALSVNGQSEIRSDIPSTDGGEENELAIQPQTFIDDFTTPHTSRRAENFRSPSPGDGRPYDARPYDAQPRIMLPKSPVQADLSQQENRSLWVPDIPAKVTLDQVFSQLCGGAVERIETFLYHRTRAYGASITFVEHSAAENFLNYVRTPQGRFIFPGVPNNWTFNVDWNPHFPQIHHRIINMARNPRVRARRCLILRNLPIDVRDAEVLNLKLGELGGHFSFHPRVLSIFIDNERRLAKISMERISCAIQLMESKIIGRWGDQFEQCTLEFDKDECERPIPGMSEISSPTSTATPIDPEYAYYQSHPDFQKMRSLYIPTLPSNTTISDLVARIRGGPLERVTLNKRTESGMLTACVVFVHHSSARAWYEYTNGPAGALRFPGLVWDWNVRWETSIAPIGRDLWHEIVDPAVKARRGFLVKNLPSQNELSVETLKEDVLSQSNKRLSFERFEIDRKKREATVIMSSIGSAIGGITMIKRLPKYKGCRIEFLRDECEDPIPTMNAIIEKQTPTNTDCAAKDIDVITQGIVQKPSYTKTVVISHLSPLITPLQLCSVIRGGALESIQIHTRADDSSALITFMEIDAAEAYYNYLTKAATGTNVAWGRGIFNSDSSKNKDVRRVLIVRGFPSIFTKERVILEVQKVVKHSAWLLKTDQKNAIESITVKGKERKIVRVVMTSIRLAVKVKAQLPRFWNSDFGKDDCEDPLAELMS